jgi:hypothetical protein
MGFISKANTTRFQKKQAHNSSNYQGGAPCCGNTSISFKKKKKKEQSQIGSLGSNLNSAMRRTPCAGYPPYFLLGEH